MTSSSFHTPGSAEKPACHSYVVEKQSKRAAMLQEAAGSQSQASTPASESSPYTLRDVKNKLSEDPMRTEAKELLRDIQILQRWKMCKNAPNKVRDAMLKLAPHWKVPRTTDGRHRPPGEVARDVENAILNKAKEIIERSVEKHVTTNEGIATKKSNNLTQTISALLTWRHTMAASREAKNSGSATKPAEIGSAGQHVDAEKLALLLESARSLNLTSHQSQDTRTKALLADALTLLAWQTHSSHINRAALMMLATTWNVPQKASGKKRKAAEIACDLETEIAESTKRVLARTTLFSSTEPECVQK